MRALRGQRGGNIPSSRTLRPGATFFATVAGDCAQKPCLLGEHAVVATTRTCIRARPHSTRHWQQTSRHTPGAPTPGGVAGQRNSATWSCTLATANGLRPRKALYQQVRAARSPCVCVCLGAARVACSMAAANATHTRGVTVQRRARNNGQGQQKNECQSQSQLAPDGARVPLWQCHTRSHGGRVSRSAGTDPPPQPGSMEHGAPPRFE